MARNWLPSYPIDDDVRRGLAGLLDLSALLAQKGVLEQRTSSTEIVRLLGQAGRGHGGSMEILSVCDYVCKHSKVVANKVVDAKLWYSFLQALTEAHTFQFFNELEGFETHGHVHGDNERGYDLDVHCSIGHLKVEIHTPVYLMGYQTLGRAIEHALLYLNSPTGYVIEARVGPRIEDPFAPHDYGWPERLTDVNLIREWMSNIVELSEQWLTSGSDSPLVVNGPNDLILECTLDRWSDERLVIQSPAGHSTDLSRTWDYCDAADLAKGPFGKFFAEKLNKRQAGNFGTGTLRAIVLDMSFSDATRPEYFMSEQYCEKLGQVVSKIVDMEDCPYDIVLPSLIHLDSRAIGNRAIALVDDARTKCSQLVDTIDSSIAK